MVKQLSWEQSSPCFHSAPAPIPRTVYFMDLILLIKEVHSLWCCSKVMWKLSICSINLAQLEVISPYKGGMDRTQDTSISLTYRGPCMRLAPGIFCWKWNLGFFASPPCEEGRAEREDEGCAICSSRSNLKQYWRREFGGNCLNFLFVKVWGCVFITSLLSASKRNMQKMEVSFWASGPLSMHSESHKVVLKWFNRLPLLLFLSHFSDFCETSLSASRELNPCFVSRGRDHGIKPPPCFMEGLRWREEVVS